MQTELIKPPVKNYRIATRVTKEHKSLFERAAILKGLSLTDFMVSVAYEAALKVLKESQVVLELGPEDSRLLFEQLLSPRQPDELPALQKAMQPDQQHSPDTEPPLDWEAKLAIYRATPPAPKTLQKPTKTIDEVPVTFDLTPFEEPTLTPQEWESEWWNIREEMRQRDHLNEVKKGHF